MEMLDFYFIYEQILEVNEDEEEVGLTLNDAARRAIQVAGRETYIIPASERSLNFFHITMELFASYKWILLTICTLVCNPKCAYVESATAKIIDDGGPKQYAATFGPMKITSYACI